MQADLLALEDEVFDENEKLVLYDRSEKWKRMSLKPGTYTLRELLVPVFVKGECVYKEPSLDEIRDYCSEQIDNLWEEVKRFENPHTYYVDLSEELWRVRKELIEEHKGVKR